MTGHGEHYRCKQARDRRACGKAQEEFGRVAVVVCAVLLSLATARPAFPASPGVDQILRKTGSVYSHLHNYRIVATRNEDTMVAQRAYDRHLTVTLDKAPHGRVRMALAFGDLDVLIVSNGTTTWSYTPRKDEYTQREAGILLKRVGAQEPEAGPTDLLGKVQNILVGRFATLWQLDKEAKLEGKSKIKFQGRKVSCYRVQFRINSFRDDFWIDRSNFLVLREKMDRRQKTGAEMSFITNTLRVKEFELHPARSAGFFKFTPPAGARRVPVLNLPGLRESLLGSSAGNFTLPDIQGKQISLSEFRGKTVVLSFWATWCPPCKMELPTMQKIYEQDKDKDVIVLTVDDEADSTIRSFLKRNHYDFTVLVDRKRTLFRKFAVHFIPTVFVINDKGIIVRHIVGWNGRQDLLAAVKAGEQ